MTRNAQNTNTTAALRLCEKGTTEAIQKKKLLVWIASFLAMTLCLFTSCEKEIEFNGEQSDPKLVINSLVEPGQRVEAYISKSYFFLDVPNTAAPEDLVPSLYVNGNLIGGMTPYVDTIWELYGIDDYHLLSGYYNDYCPQEGDIVKITASANGFDDVEGTTGALPKIVDCQMDMEVEDWHSAYYHPYFNGDEYEEDSVLRVTGHLNLTFTITDPHPGKTDCFRLTTSKDNGVRMDENLRYVSFDYDDPIFGASNFTENDFFDASDLDTRPEGVFTDMLFDGGSYQLKVKLYFQCDIDEVYDPDFFRAPFMVEHLSKEYYNYLNTCDQGDVSMQIWSEPIQTYSNVTNGFGIVAGRAVSTLWLDLPIEEP